MGILGIENRTENWKTVRYFKPFIEDEALRLCLAKRLGASEGTNQNDVRIELFWKGMRDHLHGLELDRGNKGRNVRLSRYYGELADIYPCWFRDLREKISSFAQDGSKFNNLNEMNYNIAIKNFETGLGTNLVNTEIDIVLATPDILFIGEAKDEALLDGTGNRVLVHQLIRQYVMAKILIEHRRCKREIVPFIVRKAPAGKEQLQVKFLIKQGWLKKENVLCWKCVKAIAEGKEACHG